MIHRRLWISFNRITLAAWCLLLAGSLRAEEEVPAEANNTLVRARELVEQLSSPRYSEREAASDALAKLGEDARTALNEALKIPEAETRLQVRRVLARIEQDAFQRRIDAFLADADPEADHGLPAWPRFRDLVGSDRPAREMFVGMLKAEGDLLATAANVPRSAAQSFYLRLQQLQTESSSQGREIDAASLAAVLFIASDERVPVGTGTDSLLYRFCSHSGVEQALQSKNEESLMRRIVGAWIASGRGGYYSLRLAMQHELPEGLSAAQKMLEGETPSYYRQYAILTFAKLGNKKDHVPAVMELLDDATVCTTHRVNNETFQTQFRDIALVVILHLCGEDPEDYGFERIRPHSQYVYSPYTLGFKGEEDRSAAFSQWEKAKPRLDLPAAEDEKE